MVTKALAVAYCDSGIYSVTGIACHLVYNTGMVWGITTSMWWLRCVVGVLQGGIVVALIAYTVKRMYMRRPAWGCICIAAGGLGNIVSRMVYASVVDFIVIGYGSYTWPAFNIADVAIVIGVCILIAEYEGEQVYAQ